MIDLRIKLFPDKDPSYTLLEPVCSCSAEGFVSVFVAGAGRARWEALSHRLRRSSCRIADVAPRGLADTGAQPVRAALTSCLVRGFREVAPFPVD